MVAEYFQYYTIIFRGPSLMNPRDALHHSKHTANKDGCLVW